MSHTPGPWHIAETQRGWVEADVEIVRPNQVIRAGGDVPIARVYMHADLFPNTSLIAAAPDLLAVCQLIQRLHDEGAIDTVYQTDPWRPLLDAAIAKAEGR